MSYNEKPIKVPRFEESADSLHHSSAKQPNVKDPGRDTKPELLFRKALWKEGVRYKVNCKGLPGKPDVANSRLKFVVFIDGEFWHGYEWKKKKATIKSNRKFWIPKIERNMQRDAENNLKLEALGFKVFRFWESRVQKDLDGCVIEVLNYLMRIR